MHMELETNMENVGKRFPFMAKYSVSIETVVSAELVALVNLWPV